MEKTAKAMAAPSEARLNLGICSLQAIINNARDGIFVLSKDQCFLGFVRLCFCLKFMAAQMICFSFCLTSAKHLGFLFHPLRYFFKTSLSGPYQFMYRIQPICFHFALLC